MQNVVSTVWSKQQVQRKIVLQGPEQSEAPASTLQQAL